MTIPFEAELAKQMGTSQCAIAGFGERPVLAQHQSLLRFAKAADLKMRIRFSAAAQAFLPSKFELEEQP